MLVKLLIAGLIVLSLMFIGLVWLVAVLAKITLWLPIGVTSIFVLALVAYFVFRRLQARKAARGLEDALKAQAKEQARLTRPDLQMDVLQMQQEFDEAVASLKKSKLGGGGNEALYYLPWYTIIGPPGAGKSTALRNSGLRFPHVSGTGAAVKGTGGTRNCDWWLTNEAVILDTAGRWSTQEEDHDEWLAFLGMLKKWRPRKPLNGLIAAISIGDIVNARDDEVDALAQRMRERIDEVMGHLHVVMPVYVLFTKCDLLEGFVETFGELRRSERDQVWGFTAPLTEAVDSPGKYFEQRFDELARVLESHSLERMGETRRVEDRTRSYAFPQQFMVMRRNLSRFLAALFEKNIYRETPTLRGAYFTSGTQEGRPFSLLLNRLAESMGVQERMGDAHTRVDQKSYFLHDVFMNVIFPDRDLASASEAELRRRRMVRGLVTAGLTVFALLVAGVPSFAWQQNERQLRTTASLVNRWEDPEDSVTAEGGKPGSLLERLDAVEAVAADLDAYQSGAPSWIETLGMYQGDRVQPHLRRYYANLVRRELVQPVIAHDVQALTDFGFRYESLPQARPTPKEHAEHYDMVKLHLLLTAPKTESEPGLGEAEQAWVAEQLARRWARGAKGGEVPPRVMQAAQRYVKLAAEYDELSFTRDREVLKRARAALTRVPVTHRALSRIVERVAQENYDLTLQRMIGTGGAIEASARVRGAFTRRGWDNLVRDMLSKNALEHAGELWVLGLADGDDVQEQVDEQLSQLRTMYFRAYIEEWQNFLRSLRVRQPENNMEALTLMRDLSRGQPPPLALLIQKVHANLQLEEEQAAGDKLAAAADGAVDAIKNKLGSILGDDEAEAAGKALPRGRRDPDATTAADVAEAFDGFTSFAVPPDMGEQGGPPPSVPFDVYQEQLYFVRDALQMHMDNPEESEQLMTRLQSARVRVRSLIDEQPIGWRPLFDALLWPPIEGAASSSSSAIAAAAGRNWCNEVVVPFERSIDGRYPFDRNGHDLPLDEFARFYAPDEGILWQFTKDVLGNTVQLDGDRFSFSKKLGKDASGVYRDSLLDFLQKSHDISSSFFPRGEKSPKVDFDVRIHPSPWVATTNLNIGGKEIEYHNGPERWSRMSWPGDDPEAGASMVIRGANGMHERVRQEGPWGLFRLLEAGTVTRGTDRILTLAWQLQTHDVTLKIDIRPVRGESPFFGVPGRVSKPRLLQPVRAKGVEVPDSIAHSGRACRVR